MIEVESLALERHEAMVWATLVDATADIDGNGLRAEVDRTGDTPLPILAVLDSIRFNRVITPTEIINGRDSELDRLNAFYSDRAQAHFAVEIPPAMAMVGLVSAFSLRGLVDHGGRIAKTVKRTGRVASDEVLHAVVELLPADCDAWVALTLAAWGVPRVMKPWFASSFGVADFYHFGIVEDNKLVAVGAMHIAGEFAWLGLGATHPEHRGKGLQFMLLEHRAHVAADFGCRWVHSETFLEPGEKTNASLRNMLRAGYDHLYDRVIYERGSGPVGDGADLIGT